MKDRKPLVLRWVDERGIQRQKTAGTSSRKEAERIAGKLEAELNEGRYKEPNKITWEQFRILFEDEKLRPMSKKTIDSYMTTMNHIERYLNPIKLSDITTQSLSTFAAKLRTTGVAETTVAKYIRHTKALINWAHGMELLTAIPRFPKIKTKRTSTVMKGRPITNEEFQLMLNSVSEIVGDERAPQWCNYLKGLWLSGLRLRESLELYWDRTDKLHIDLTQEYPMLRINGQYEKGKKDRLLPIVPEFASFLLETPCHERSGLVFKLTSKITKEQLKPDEVSKVCSKIGKRANILVSEENERLKYASAHDLRRAYGLRWAKKVMPDQLKELMRHTNVQITLDYYIGVNAQRIAKDLWEANHGTSLETT